MRKALIVMAALLLAACADKTEIQHDGTGTDEMLKSPCVGVPGSPCSPVPYDAPAFTWTRKVG